MSNPRNPLIVTLYGGPGTGKSTTSAAVFAALKQLGYNAEMAHEYAKDLTWEGALGKLAFQPYIAAKQMWRLERLRGKVEVIVTDTSTLLGLIYGEGTTQAFRDWIVDDYVRQNTFNVFLQRDPRRPYNPAGRSQTEEEAVAADGAIQKLLDDIGISYVQVPMDLKGDTHVSKIVDLVEDQLSLLETLREGSRLHLEKATRAAYGVEEPEPGKPWKPEKKYAQNLRDGAAEARRLPAGQRRVPPSGGTL